MAKRKRPVDAILGGYDGLSYGCNIQLEIYT